MSDRVATFINAAFILVGAFLVFIAGYFSTRENFSSFMVVFFLIIGIWVSMARVHYDDDGEDEEE